MKKAMALLSLGSVVGFWLAWQVAEHSVRLPVLPTFFELDGEPKTVDGIAVHSWEEVNKVLKAKTQVRHAFGSSNFSYRGEDGKRQRDRSRVECELEVVEVTFVPRAESASGAPRSPQVVRVRSWLPATLEFARTGRPENYVRYEVVQDVDNE